MSLNLSIANAMSGLQASARGVQLASSNIANAMVEGYAPRRLALASAAGSQGGVRITGIHRQDDPALAGMLRQSGAETAAAGAETAFWERLAEALGEAGDGNSLAGRITALENALADAADRPDLDYLLASAARAAGSLAGALNDASEDIRSQRQAADAAIAGDVETLNRGLGEVARLNTDILRRQAGGDPALDLVEKREMLVTELSDIVPLREQLRPDGRLALYTAGGQMLLDGTQPMQIGFQPSAPITAAMSLADGQLSGLTLDGQPVPSGPGAPIGGGRLGAHFAIRDSHAPAAQSQLDQFAAELIARFADPATDPSLPDGAPGLFTDAGGVPDTPPAPGLAGRVALNDALTPAGGGEYWRLRDGLGATAPGLEVGDPAQLMRLLDAIEAPLAATGGGAARSLAGHAGQLVGTFGQSRHAAEMRGGFAQSRHDTLFERMLAGGVDTDGELQRLMTLEKAYAANARVMQVADDLLRRLLEI
ncbi:MAG: flagellar hook-associated protein FlgK [Pararhodobacter sp.]|nr:flagellar hook-associated protein FlgK [Pararhodobacter sp.]